MPLEEYWYKPAAVTATGTSLRFRGNDQHLLGPQDSTMTGLNSSRWTTSLWFKRGSALNAEEYLMSAWYDATATGTTVRFNADNRLRVANNGPSLPTFVRETNQVFRDPSAWYHLVWQLDSSASPRNRIYLNGVEITSWATSSGDADVTFFNYPQDQLGIACRKIPWVLGANSSGCDGETVSNFFHGYIADFRVYNNRVIPIDDLGSFVDGAWAPLAGPALDGGADRHLTFSDPTNIGENSAPGSVVPDFIPRGSFELTNTASTDYDWMADSPTDNYSTLNPLDNAGLALDSANLTGNTEHNRTASTVVAPVTSGKYYVEFEVIANGNGLYGVGAAAANKFYPSESTGLGAFYGADGSITLNGAGVTGGAGYSGGAVVGLAFDMDAAQKTLQFYLNGAKQGTAVNLFDTQLGWIPVLQATSASTSGARVAYNAGNRPLKHLPAGFLPLSTAGLPAVTITNPSNHFQTVLDTGANILATAQATFPNGLWWIKDRDNANDHQLVDSVRGGNLVRRTPNNDAEAVIPYVAPTGNSVAWCWNLLGDRSNGFDIVEYTGDDTVTRNIAHNLGAEPEMVMVSNRDFAGFTHIVVRHKDQGGNCLHLTTTSEVNTGVFGYVSGWDSTNFTIQQGSTNYRDVNNGGQRYITYLWRSIPGYSAFGRYTGNGSADGPFIYTGFRPAFLLIKRTDAVDPWVLFDTARDTYNPTGYQLNSDSTAAENYNTANILDITSNGFKQRATGTRTNGSGASFIYAAFAEHPFGGSNVSPSPAR